MKKTVLLLVLFLGTLALGMAQSKENDFLDQPYIEVTGTAMMEVVPDEIYVKIILREKDQRGKTELEQQEKKLYQTLQKVGIDVKKDLAVRNMAGNRYKLKSGAMKLRKEYVLLLHDVNTLDRVLRDWNRWVAWRPKWNGWIIHRLRNCVGRLRRMR